MTIEVEARAANRGLARYMDENGYSLSMMAEKLGITPSMVSFLRSGNRAVSDGIRWRFALAFGFRRARDVLGDGYSAE